MKKPFFYSLGASIYIVLIVLLLSTTSSITVGKTLLVPMMVLSLLVISVAVMGFLFLSEPFNLYMENRKKEAFVFFGKIVGFFACFALLFLLLFFVL